MPKRHLVWVAVITLLAVAFWKLPRTIARLDTLDKAFGALVAVRAEIAKHFVEPIDQDKLISGAIEGMLRELDPFSAYLSPEEFEAFRKHADGQFGGVGIELTMQDGRMLVVTPIENTPAYYAGVLAGDQILAVDGDSTESMTVMEVIRRITGEPGTSVGLTLLHPTHDGPRSITLLRSIVNISPIAGWYRGVGGDWVYFVDPDHRIAYVRLTSFVPASRDDLERTISRLRDERMRAVVLDLRFNGGGLLNSAIEVTDLFVDSGTIVTTRRGGALLQEWTAADEGTLASFPMVVLINRSSASASEIVAGALRDHKRATVVGERSFGKGSVQNLFPLPPPYNGAHVKLTVAYYHLPNGECIHRRRMGRRSGDGQAGGVDNGASSPGWGVEPNVEVLLNDEENRRLRLAWRAAGVIQPATSKPRADSAPDPGGSGVASRSPPSPPPIDPQLEAALAVLRDRLAVTSEAAATER